MKNKVKLNLSFNQMIRHTKRMVVLPGPAIIVIPIALAILATEFIWAKIILQKVKERIGLIKRRVGLRKKLNCYKLDYCIVLLIK